MGAVASALIGGGVSLINQSLNNRNIDAANAENRRLMELQYQRSLQMQNFQNYYNSPAQAMFRYVSAGLNPHLIYGSSGNSPASSVMAPSPLPTTPRRSELDVANSVALVNALLAAEKQKTEIENIKANTRKINSDTDKIDVGIEIDKYNRDVLLPLQKKLLDKDWDLKTQEEFWNDIDRLDEHNSKMIEIAKSNEELQRMLRNRDVLDALLRGSLSELYARINNLNASASLANAQADVAVSQKGLVEAQTDLVKSQTKRTDVGTAADSLQFKFARDVYSYRVAVEKYAARSGALDAYNKYVDALYKNDMVELDKQFRTLQIKCMKNADSRAEKESIRQSFQFLHDIVTSNTSQALDVVQFIKQ